MEGQNAAREVNLMDTLERVSQLNAHAENILRRCVELRAHVEGVDEKTPQADVPKPIRATRGLVGQLHGGCLDLSDTLAAIDRLLGSATSRLGMPPSSLPPAASGPRLARG